MTHGDPSAIYLILSDSLVYDPFDGNIILLPEVVEPLQVLDLNQLEDLVEVAMATDSLAEFVSGLG